MFDKSEYAKMIPYSHYSPSEDDLAWVEWSLRYLYAEGKFWDGEFEKLLKSLRS